MIFFSRAFFFLLLLLVLCLCPILVLALDRVAIQPFPDVSLGHPITLRPVTDGVFVEASPGVKPGDLVACMRVRIVGVSRLQNVDKFAFVTRIKVQAAGVAGAADSYRKAALPKVEVCLHRNGSMGVAQCARESWRALDKGFWSGAASPYETKFVDIRVTESYLDVPLNISAEEESQPHRYAFLVVGMLFLLVAPVVSEWVPFYYSSAMTLGIFLVVLILLYQGMKLLPTGRKSSLYLLLYGSLLGLGTVVMHYFSGLISTLLNELGLGDELFNPVAVFLGLGIVLFGAWLGYWGVRKMVLAENGGIDAGVSKFVKWAIRIIGATMLLQSSYDGVFSVIALALGSGLIWLIGKLHLEESGVIDYLEHRWTEYLDSEGFLVWAGEKRHQFWPSRRSTAYQPSLRQVPIKRPYMNRAQAEAVQNLPGKEALARWDQGNILSKRSPIMQRLDEGSPCQKDFYSSYHKTPGRKRLSSSDYKATDITVEAVDELVKSRGFQDWWATNVVRNNRVSIAPNEHRQERPEEEVEATAYMPQDPFTAGKS